MTEQNTTIKGIKAIVGESKKLPTEGLPQWGIEVFYCKSENRLISFDVVGNSYHVFDDPEDNVRICTLWHPTTTSDLTELIEEAIAK